MENEKWEEPVGQTGHSKRAHSKPVGALENFRQDKDELPSPLALETDFLVMHTSYVQITMWHPGTPGYSWHGLQCGVASQLARINRHAPALQHKATQMAKANANQVEKKSHLPWGAALEKNL